MKNKLIQGFLRGANQIRTGDRGVADLCLTTWLWRRILYYTHIFKKYASIFLNDSYGNRTRVTAVKGRCLNRLTKEPFYALLREALVTITVPSKPHM